MSDPREALATQVCEAAGKFRLGDPVRKIKGSQWSGRIVGTYSTELTPEGYAVESFTEKGSVQIYPASALELCEEPGECVAVPRELLEELRDCANECANQSVMRGTDRHEFYERLTEQADALLAQQGKETDQ